VLTEPRFEGLVLRFGRLYGPETWSESADMPPTVHVADAAQALASAIERGRPGAYNIAEDDGPVRIDKARSELAWEPRQAVRL
jgi:nucleoside-diphosphate-sugar epimerase